MKKQEKEKHERIQKAIRKPDKKSQAKPTILKGSNLKGKA